jgi:hypothetical protein
MAWNKKNRVVHASARKICGKSDNHEHQNNPGSRLKQSTNKMPVKKNLSYLYPEKQVPDADNKDDAKD